MTDPVAPIERAVFGDVGRRYIDDWLAALVRNRLGTPMRSVLWRSGRVSAVYGLSMADGTSVAVKVFRPLDRASTDGEMARLTATAYCQRALAAASFPCPTPIDGPAVTSGRITMIEQAIEPACGGDDAGDPHRPGQRRALATSLADQIDVLGGFTGRGLAIRRPAWVMYDDGPWPVPHDPIFDFGRTPTEYQWLDHLAQAAADILRTRPEQPTVIAHSDWSAGNVRFADDRVSMAYDWDSLVEHTEPVLAGSSAGSYLAGSTAGSQAPSPDEVARYLQDYDDARPGRFSADQQVCAAAAATWVLAYNARCGLSLPGPGHAPEPLELVARHRNDYLAIRW